MDAALDAAVLDAGMWVMPDSGADVTQKLQRSIDCAVGKTIIFRPGVYLVNGSLIQLRAGVSISAYGAVFRLIPGSYASMSVILGTGTAPTWDASVPETAGVRIYGLEIDGNASNITTSRSCTGIFAYRARDWILRDVNIHDLPGNTGEGYGFIAAYSDEITFDGVVKTTDRQNVCVWETTNASIENCTLADSRARECILVSSFSPATFKKSTARISNSKCTNNLISGTHVIRWSGESSGSMDNLDITGVHSGNSGLHGIYITDNFPKTIVATNIKINGAWRGVEIASDAAHKITFNGVEIGAVSTCYDGIYANTDLSSIKFVGGYVEAENRALYCNAANYQSFIGVEFVGGTQASSVVTELGGTTQLIGNVFRGNTSATYPLLVSGSGTPVIACNTAVGNTVNTMRCYPTALAVGNSAIIVDGAAKTGTQAKSGATASRPSLNPYDAGYVYFDTTLAASGKPIFWTGSAWLDSAGIPV